MLFMEKFLTRDEKTVKIKVDPKNTALIETLVNTIPRLSYDEILEGELKKRLGNAMSEIELDLSPDVEIKDVLLSKAIFDAISKPMGS